MRLALISDTHTEMRKDLGRRLFESFDPSGVDILIMAGDIWSLKRSHWPETLAEIVCKKYKDVVFVTGNHCYYGTSPSEAHTNLLPIKMRFPNFHRLHCGEVEEIQGQRFLGGTLWFPDQPDNFSYRGLLNDFSQIQKFVPWVYGEHAGLVNGLERNLRPGDVVVTHHMPSALCINELYKGDPINRFFHCNLENLILDKKPKVWFCGHSHLAVDVTLGDTRIRSWPCGYPSERIGQPDYQPLVIDI